MNRLPFPIDRRQFAGWLAMLVNYSSYSPIYGSNVTAHRANFTTDSLLPVVSHRSLLYSTALPISFMTQTGRKFRSGTYDWKRLEWSSVITRIDSVIRSDPSPRIRDATRCSGLCCRLTPALTP